MPNQNHQQNLLTVFSSLSDTDLIALRNAGSLHIRGTNLYAEPSDLIHEALLRCLEGRRHWDGCVPFTVFLSNVMRSIASADRNSFETRQFVNANTFEENGMPDGLGWLAPRAPSAEEDNMARERAALGRRQITNLKTAFADDWIVLELINAWFTGDRSPQITQQFSISFQEFEAARRRLQRHIRGISPTEGGQL
jgi:RNA polymerase sigma-70 factor (ECF subfamily)